MRQEGIRAKTVKKWRATTQSNHRLPVALNTLHRQFTVTQPNRVWAGDLTYVWTTEGWLYLAVVLDLYSRLVIGWAMGHRLTVDLAKRALIMALANRTPTAGLLHHSDRGSQYAATSYQRLLDAHGITTSMSRQGNCWDNACVESFFGTLKRGSCTIGTTRPVKTQDRTSSSTLRCSITGSAVTRPSAMTPRPSTKRGRRLLNPVSTELGEGQKDLPRTRQSIIATARTYGAGAGAVGAVLAASLCGFVFSLCSFFSPFIPRSMHTH